MADGKLRVDLIFGAVANHVAPALRGISAESDRASKALAAARTQSNQLKGSLSDIGAYKAQQSAIVTNNQKLAEAKSRYEALSHEFMAAEAPSEKLSRSLIKQRDEVTRLTLKQRDQVQGLGEMGRKLDEAGLSTRDLGRHEDRLRADLARTTTEIDKQRGALVELSAQQARQRQIRGQYDKTQALAGTMQGAGMSAIGAGTAVGAPIALAARDAIAFENVMLDVRKVVDFDTPQQFEQMGDDILTLSTRIPIAGEGIAQIIAAAGQARIPRQELLGFAEDAGKMGVAFDITAEEAGKTMATWRTAFAMTQPQVRGLADQVNMLGDSNNATAAQISAVLTRIGPLGAVAGLAAAEVAALSATTVAMGVNEEIATTGVKNLMLALTKGEAATKAQKTAFSALGLEATAVAKAMQDDAGAAITDVLQRVSQLDPERQAAILTQLFGSESVSALAPLVNGLDEVRRNLDAVGDAAAYSGSMQREFANRSEGAAAQIELARNGLKAMSTDFGQMFLPVLKSGAGLIGNLAAGVRHFTQVHPGASRAVGTLVAVLAGGLLIFGGLAVGIAAVLGPFALLRMSIAQTLPMMLGLGHRMMFVARGAQWMAVSALSKLPAALGGARAAMLGFNAVLLANPIGLLVVGIAAVATGAFLIIRNWSAISGFFRGVWSVLREIVGLGMDAIMYILVTRTPLGMIMRNWGPISGFIGGVWDKVKSGVTTALGVVGALISNWGPLQPFKVAFAAVFDWFGKLPETFRGFGKNLIDGMVSGIRGQRAELQAATAAATRAGSSGVTTTARIQSPSRLFAEHGRDLMAGLVVGIRDRTPEPMRAMARATTGVAGAAALALAPAAVQAAAPKFVQGSLLRPPAEIAAERHRDDGRTNARRAQGAMLSGATFHITIQMLPGQDPRDAVQALMDEVERRGGGPADDGGNGSYEDDGWGEE